MVKSTISDDVTLESAATVVLDTTEKALIRVLYVDDETSLLKVVKQCLEMQGGFQVDIAPSVEEAMRKMKGETYDAIVSDYQMPEKDGLELLRGLRERGNNIPFIIFTGKGREEVAIKALNLGADQYLNKTGDPQTVYCELAHGIRQAVERNKAEEKIRESEQELRSVFDATVDGIAYVDTSGKIIAANKRLVEEMLGYRMDEAVGENFGKLIRNDPKGLPMLPKMMAEVLTTGKPVRNLEVRLIRKDGNEISAEVNTSVLKKEERVAGIIAVISDITERRKAELELFEKQTRLQNILAASPDAITLVDLKGNIVECNQASVNLYGYSSKEELIGKNALDFAAKKDYQRALENMKKTIEQEQTRNLVYTLVTRQGRETEVEVAANTVRDASGVPVGFVAVVRDITERKRSEQKIRESREKFERLFMNNPEAAAYMDPDFHILDVNPSFEKLFGYSMSEVKGKYINDVIVPKDKMEDAEMLNKKTRNEQVYHDSLRKRRDGSLVSVSISAAPINVEGRLVGYMELYKDITARNEIERELDGSKRHFQTLFNLMVDPVAIVDSRGKILEVTQRAEEVTGFKREELIGRNFLKIEILSAKSKAILIKNLAKRMMGMHIAPYEVDVLTKDGRKLPHEVNATKIEYNSKPADLVVFRDVSERKKMEEKLRVVGSLTRHDVRNKLSVVTGNVFLAKKKLTGNEEVSEHLREIELGCQQIVRILEFSKDYEMLGVEELTNIDVRETFEKAISLFSNLNRIRIENECRGLVVLADSLLRQVFYNLVDNSLKYGERVGRIRVHYEEAGKDQLRLVYEDDGVGIPSAEKPQLFKEGYGKGTGYGLFMIRRICEVYGWSIQETGEQGKGAQFTMTIPKTNQEGKQNYQLRHHF